MLFDITDERMFTKNEEEDDEQRPPPQQQQRQQQQEVAVANTATDGNDNDENKTIKTIDKP